MSFGTNKIERETRREATLLGSSKRPPSLCSFVLYYTIVGKQKSKHEESLYWSEEQNWFLSPSSFGQYTTAHYSSLIQRGYKKFRPILSIFIMISEQLLSVSILCKCNEGAALNKSAQILLCISSFQSLRLYILKLHFVIKNFIQNIEMCIEIHSAQI